MHPRNEDNHITGERARAFVAELRAFEQDGDPSGLLRQFGEQPRLARLDGRGERTDAERFWQEYRSQFSRVSTTFRNAVESDRSVALEWDSDVVLSGGRALTYSGVTVLDIEPDGTAISGLRTYYDTAAFAPGPAADVGRSDVVAVDEPTG